MIYLNLLLLMVVGASAIPINGDRLNGTMSGIEYIINKTWKGDPIIHDPFYIHMQMFPPPDHGDYRWKISMQGPFFNDPPAPKEPANGGYLNDLWAYEVFEVFFANDQDQYLEVEVGPHGHWLALLLHGQRKAFNLGKNLNISIHNTIKGRKWNSVFEIPLAYFPANVTKFNAYAIHGSEDKDRHYEALYPVTNNKSDDKPDFHRLQYFKPIDIQKLIPQGLNDQPFVDELYGNLWANMTMQVE